LLTSKASIMCGLWGRQSIKNWKIAATTLGCTDSSKELQCMQSKTTAQIVDAAKNIPRNGSFPPAFVPVIDNKVVFEDYNDRAAKGQFLKVVRRPIELDPLTETDSRTSSATTTRNSARRK
jgi:hypothetical protein